MSVYQWIKTVLLTGILACLIILIFYITDINDQLEYNNDVSGLVGSYITEIYNLLEE